MRKLIPILAVIALGGCTTYQPSFTAISSKNINTDDLHVDQNMFKGIVSAEDCQHIIFVIPTKPVTLSDTLDEALDSVNANLLLKPNIRYFNFYIPFIYGQNCLKVQGRAYDLSK